MARIKEKDMFTGFWNKARKDILWTVQFFFVSLIAIWIVSLALNGILSKAYPNGITIFSDMRCLVGIVPDDGSGCIKKTTNQTIEELNKYKALSEELQTKLNFISGIEDKWNNIHLFTTKVYNNSSDVTSGIKYPSLLNGAKWSNAWCYWQPETSAIEFKITLGTVTFGNDIKWRRIPEKELEAANVSLVEIEATRLLCQWPEGVKS